jgi:hypothetical protein
MLAEDSKSEIPQLLRPLFEFRLATKEEIEESKVKAPKTLS